MNRLIKQNALALFCGLTIALTFAATLLPLPGELVAVVMVFIPALLSISLTAVSEGKTGVRSLLGKLGHRLISFRWVIIALALALVIRLTMSLVALGLGIIPAMQLRPGGAAQYVILAIVFFVFAIPEELGWRGYALPKLLERYSPISAALIIGVLWGSLHLALLLPGMMNEGASPLATLLGLVGGSVLFTWLYVNSDGSVILTTLFHAAQSFFVIVNGGLTGTQQAWLMAGVYLAAALIVVLVSGSRLTRRPVARVPQTTQAPGIGQPLARK
jgi:uncharacterized protein